MKSKAQLFIPLILAFISFQLFIANEIAIQWAGVFGFVLTIILGIWLALQVKGWLKLIPIVTTCGVIIYLCLWALLVLMMGSGG